MTYVLALDQGTTSSRAIVFDRGGTVISSAQKEFRQIFPQPGWVEHDPNEIWSSQVAVATEALAKAHTGASDIAVGTVRGLYGNALRPIGCNWGRTPDIYWILGFPNAADS